jgi:hypothetical protein
MGEGLVDSAAAPFKRGGADGAMQAPALALAAHSAAAGQARGRAVSQNT